MKIKHYRAADMRQALRQVREAQGPDAVILSSRRLANGVEVVAAVDYDVDVADASDAGEPAPRNPLIQPPGRKRRYPQRCRERQDGRATSRKSSQCHGCERRIGSHLQDTRHRDESPIRRRRTAQLAAQQDDAEAADGRDEIAYAREPDGRHRRDADFDSGPARSPDQDKEDEERASPRVWRGGLHHLSTSTGVVAAWWLSTYVTNPATSSGTSRPIAPLEYTAMRILPDLSSTKPVDCRYAEPSAR